MKRLLIAAALAGAMSVGSGATMAGGIGTNIEGALLENPARLGFSPTITAVVGAQLEVPALAALEPFVNKATHKLELTFDVTDTAKAMEAAATIDALVESLSGINPEVAVGLSLGRLGVGLVSRTETKVSSATSVDVGESSVDISGEIDLGARLLTRLDASASLAIPIAKVFSLGATAKYTGIGDVGVNMALTSEQIKDGLDSLMPEGYADLGLGILFDVGLMLNLKNIQADIALKDIGELVWEAQALPWDSTSVPGTVGDHASLMHLAGGVTLKPTDALSVGAYYDRTLSGKDQLKLSAEVRPIKLLTIRAGYTTDIIGLALEPGVITAGVGVNLGFVGLDIGTTIRDSIFTGASARFRIGF